MPLRIWSFEGSYEVDAIMALLEVFINLLLGTFKTIMFVLQLLIVFWLGFEFVLVLAFAFAFA